MKRVLVDYMGGICHIVCPNGDDIDNSTYVSEEFPVVSGPGCSSKWVDAPDEVEEFWRLEKGEWVDRSKSYTDPIRARVVAYGSFGDQLDMIYKDMLNNTKNWEAHITKVKSEIVMDAELINFGVIEPIFHSVASPSWSFLPGEGEEEITI